MNNTDELQYLSSFQPVLQALRQRRRTLYRLHVSRQRDLDEVLRMAKVAGVPVNRSSAEKVGQMAGTAKHQGVVLECGPLPTFPLEELLRYEPADGRDLLVLLAGVEDPRNLGAVARTCSFLGARALVRPGKGTAPLSPAASRASAGALESLPIGDASSAPLACELLSAAGYEILGLEREGEPLSVYQGAFPKVTLVVGGEDRGLSKRVRAQCSRILSIEGRGPTGSLNLSVAAGIAIHHVIRCQKQAG